MARGEYPVWQADFFKDNGVELVTEPGDKEILNQGTIDYISFSMYRSTTCTADSELKMNVLSFDPNPYLCLLYTSAAESGLRIPLFLTMHRTP